MSEWKAWNRQFEREMRDAMRSVRDAIRAADPGDIAEDAADFAQTIVECVGAPLAAFMAGLPRAMDINAWKDERRRAARDWDDED